MDTTIIVDTLWVLVAAILVFFMNLGFASVEAGFARSKNTVNILSKNFIVFAVSSRGFMLLGDVYKRQGQYILVLPKKNAVVCVQALEGRPLFPAVWKYIAQAL